jgi:thioredoxin reductase (NADPH)
MQARSKKIVLYTLISLAIGMVGLGIIYRQELLHKTIPAMLTRAAGWFASKADTTYSPEQLRTKERIIPVAIMGSGPAGLSAALYCARGGMHTVVFDGVTPGGQLMGTSWVENWPGRPKTLGPDLIKSLRTQAQEFGALFVNDTVTAVDTSTWPFEITTAQGGKMYALTLIVATGSKPRGLQEGDKKVPGEQEYWGKGVAVCATCDAPFYKKAQVIVVGGGEVAAEDAIQLSGYAQHVTMVVRKPAMKVSATTHERLKAHTNISIKYNTIVTAITGDSNHVTGVNLLNNGAPESMAVTGVFLATGSTPNSSVFENKLTLNNGYIVLQEGSQKTSVPGIFAAGDVTDFTYKQAGVAAGAGIRAALDVLKFLQEHTIEPAALEESTLFVPEGGVGRVAVRELTSMQDFERASAQEKPILIDFYTDLCPTCAQVLIGVERVSAQYGTELDTYKVNVAKIPELAKKMLIEHAPTVVIIHDGAVVARMHDTMSYRQLSQMVEAAIHGATV